MGGRVKGGKKDGPNFQFPNAKCQMPLNRKLEMGTKLLKEATTLNQDLTERRNTKEGMADAR
jgi:hypothetical protein